MPLFIANAGAATTQGVHIVEVATPSFIPGIGLRRAGLAAQFEWGPISAYAPTTAADLVEKYFPAGSARTSTGWLALVNRRRGLWTIRRVLGGAAGLLPPDGLTLTNIGAAGAAVYKYVVVAKNASGATVASHWVRTATGNDNLGGGNGITIAWSAVTGATSYDVYRTYAGGATTNTVGKLGNTASATINDTGAALGSETAPTSNTTGYAQAVIFIYSSASATATNATAGEAVLRAVLKYPGTTGNSVTATVADDTGADATKFDLTFTLTNSVTGTTTKKYVSLKSTATVVLPSSSTVTNNDPLLYSLALVGTPTARPANGTYTAANGSNGSAVVATDYDTALDQLDAEDDIAVYMADDCGDTIRGTVNGYLATHATALKDRIALLSANKADAWATVKGNSGAGVGANRDVGVLFFHWVLVKDINGTDQYSPACTFAATALINLEPQQSHAWWNSIVTSYYNSGLISGLANDVFNPLDPDVQADALALGICLMIKTPGGRYAFNHGRTTSLAENERFATTRRIKIYWGLSLREGLSPWTNGPNNAPERRRVVKTIVDFLEREGAAGRIAEADETQPDYPAGSYIYSVDGTSLNTLLTIAAGENRVGISAQNPSDMEKIILFLESGTTVTPVL